MPRAPQGATRPTGVTVFAILNILFGIMGVLGIIASSAVFVVGSRFGPNPVLDKMLESTGYMAFTVAGLVLGFIFAIVLLIAGIGLLKMSQSARNLSIIYGVYAICSSLIANAVNVVVVFMPMMEQAQGAQRAGMIGGMVGAVVGGAVSLIYPIALLIYFTRPGVKRAFETWSRPN